MNQSEKKIVEILKNYFNNIALKNVSLKPFVSMKLTTLLNNKNIRYDMLFKGNFSSLFEENKSNSEPKTKALPEKKISDTKKVTHKEDEVKKTNYISLDFPKLFGGLKENVTLKKAATAVPKWKSNPPKVTLEGINSRTSHILSSIQTVEHSASKIHRLEEFLDHLIQHPEASNFAVKSGAVNVLLNVRLRTADEETHKIIRVCLAALGYAGPPGSSGIRILSIDGGGMRGIAVIRMLQKIEEISGRRIYDLFDFICGVSTGAIITCALIPPNKMSMEQIYDLYRNLSAKVFKQSAFWGTSKLVWSHAYYDTSLWEAFLKDYVGSINLIDLNQDDSCPKIAVVSAIVNNYKVAPFIFRNYGNPWSRSSEYDGSFRHTMFEAVRASAAAPTIFEEFKTGDMLHQDGGIVVNNPAAIALHEARCLWPDESINCVVSIGTGKYDPVYPDKDLEEFVQSSTSWKQMFDKILESATDTEAVHRILNDLLPHDTYYRLNPHLSRVVSMDETSNERLIGLEEDTKMYCRRNEEKFYEIAAKLLKSRPPHKILKDGVVMQMRLSRLM